MQMDQEVVCGIREVSLRVICVSHSPRPQQLLLPSEKGFMTSSVFPFIVGFCMHLCEGTQLKATTKAMKFQAQVRGIQQLEYCEN